MGKDKLGDGFKHNVGVVLDVLESNSGELSFDEVVSESEDQLNQHENTEQMVSAILHILEDHGIARHVNGLWSIGEKSDVESEEKVTFYEYEMSEETADYQIEEAKKSIKSVLRETQDKDTIIKTLLELGEKGYSDNCIWLAQAQLQEECQQKWDFYPDVLDECYTELEQFRNIKEEKPHEVPSPE